MVFSSLIFLCIFLPANLLLYYVIKDRTYRNWVLIVTSLVFYAWGEPVWVTILLFSTFFDCFNAVQVEKYRGDWRSKAFVAFSVIGNLLILFYFKYAGFFVENVNNLLGTSIHIKTFSLPIGISFYTFQTLSYVVDVYRGEVKAQRDPFKLLLFVSLFHQLVAGPIVRYQDIAEEIEHRVETLAQFNQGVSRFIIGLGKKVIFANTAGEIAKAFMDTDYSKLPILGAWFGIVLFALQIYFDFAGYSDMAIGLGKMFGFTYKENFDYPYISKTATEFWRRWHISLGTFFRDYVYIPLGGNRKLQFRNLFIVWFLTGMWHGASWNFIIWGLYYGALIMLERAFLSKLLGKLPSLVSRVYLIAAVLVGWVFFYHTDMSKAAQFLGVMFGRSAASWTNFQVAMNYQNNSAFLLAALIGCTPITKIIYLKFKGLVCGSMEMAAARAEAAAAGIDSLDIRTERVKKRSFSKKLGKYLLEELFEPAVRIGILIVSIILLVGQTYNPFLYFRF